MRVELGGILRSLKLILMLSDGYSILYIRDFVGSNIFLYIRFMKSCLFLDNYYSLLLIRNFKYIVLNVVCLFLLCS